MSSGSAPASLELMAPVWAVGTVLSGWRPWFRAAVSAENLKPIIKSTVSQSAFYYPHASSSKQCQ